MIGTNYLDELTRQYAKAVYESGALLIREEPFTLRSGKKSHLYINHREFLSSSANIQLLAKIYVELIRRSIGGECTIASVDSIMSPVLCGAITVYAGQNVVSVRSKKLEHGTEENIYGNVSGPVAVVDDMTSTGGTLLEAARVLREAGHTVTHAIVSVVRDETLKEVFSKEGISLQYIATLPDLAYRVPDLPEESAALLQGELETRQ